jgi:CO/xanthine dehydrogenase FAD-binding subunit
LGTTENAVDEGGEPVVRLGQQPEAILRLPHRRVKPRGGPVFAGSALVSKMASGRERHPFVRTVLTWRDIRLFFAGRPARSNRPSSFAQFNADAAPFSRPSAAVQSHLKRYTKRCRAISGARSLYLKPKTLDEAVNLLASSGGQILAGGTDFYPSLGERLPQGRVVDITALREIRGISIQADEIRIGGLTTWSDVVRAPLPRCLDALKAAAREVGSVQIQNRGTVAGNLCNASPAADGVPPLLALDADVELASAAGARRMPLEKFLAGYRKTQRRPDEILAAVLVPRRMEDAASAFLKLGARRYLVISISMVAVVVQSDAAGRVTEAHVAVGSCSAKALRLTDLEQGLVGLPFSRGIGAAVKAKHLAFLTPIDDVRATADYRRDASLTLVQRALDACVETP